MRIIFASCGLTSRSLLRFRNLFLRKTSPILFSHLSLNPETTLSLLSQKILSRIPPNSSLRCYLNSNDFANRLAPAQHWLSLTSQLPNVIPVVTLGILLVIMGSKLTERRRKRKSRMMIRRKRRKNDLDVSDDEDFMFLARDPTLAQSLQPDDWILDSGCSHLIVRNKNNFSLYISTPSHKISGISDTSSSGHGNILLSFALGSSMRACMLRDVLHCPSAHST